MHSLRAEKAIGIVLADDHVGLAAEIILHFSLTKK